MTVAVSSSETSDNMCQMHGLLRHNAQARISVLEHWHWLEEGRQPMASDCETDGIFRGMFGTGRDTNFNISTIQTHKTVTSPNFK
jgi:hypothetical protein